MLGAGDGAGPFPPTASEGIETSEFIEHRTTDPHEAEGAGLGGGTIEAKSRVDESLPSGGGQVITIDMSRESGRDAGQRAIDQVEQFDWIGCRAGRAEGIWCYHDETPAGGLGLLGHREDLVRRWVSRAKKIPLPVGKWAVFSKSVRKN
ncbi:MAG: hypothetical protein SynsKO_45070 [Synoicihabitans sp.]